jgi:hypothetical protein
VYDARCIAARRAREPVSEVTIDLRVETGSKVLSGLKPC